VPTDCPNRDERKGGMGDSAITAEEAIYNYGMGAVYTRWLMLIEDDQLNGGAVTDFVPATGWFGNGSPNWQSAYPSIMWAMHEYYGDIAPVERHHASLCEYYASLEAHFRREGCASFHEGNMYGDWVVPPPNAMGNKSLIASFAMVHDLQMGIRLFNASSHPQAKAQAAHLASLAAAVAADFHRAFFNATAGYYGSGLQTEQSLPLFLGIVPAPMKPRVLAHLVHDIVDVQHNHTTSGIVGIKCTLEVLSREGYTDVALAMLEQDSYPSYGYMLTGGAHGYEPATTLWELWDADTQGPRMNSRNHIMFGSVGSWMYKWLAGIRPLQPGFTRAAVEPRGFGLSNLTHASASVSTPQGHIRLSWRLDRLAARPTLSVSLTIPVGSVASVTLPLFQGERITEGGRLVWTHGSFVPGVDGVSAGAATAASGGVRLEVTSGRYSFVVD